METALENVMIDNGDKIPIKRVGDLKLFDKISKAFFIFSYLHQT